ncbi:hypothetical protein GPJ56_002879 [Histomonas meleagridis]|uniref:uncharacterized protein n=1 Tax=Histomonas meleagridis TaxID=135588 RepID=UPI003559830F|nr:hypothetical protein GPJ56_002879 [Histomonas meleagridis]KAH0800420.1 hypothetical protein GO595_006831 [Histomonas meleagridis]
MSPRKIKNPHTEESHDEMENDKDLQPLSGDLTHLGLPPLALDSDPFLSPIKDAITCNVKRHRIWIKGIKGEKYSISTQGETLLVAKRKMKYMKKTWFISKSMNFSLDTPDLAGILVKQRTGISFTLISPRARQTDSFRQILGGIDLEKPRKVILAQDLWLPPDEDDIFSVTLEDGKYMYLHSVGQNYQIQSVKNGSFSPTNDASNICFRAEKGADETLTVDAKAPLSLVQVFGISLSLFLQ